MRTNTFDAVMGRQKLVITGLVCLLSLSLLTSSFLAFTKAETRVVLLPGHMSGEWEISSTRYDEVYLADASASLAEIYMETTPSTAEWRRQAILRWVHPESSQQVIEQLDEETEGIRRQKLSSAFAIKEIAVKETDGQAVVRVTGELIRFVTNKPFAQDSIVVIIKWRRDVRGAATVSDIEWREVLNDEQASDF